MIYGYARVSTDGQSAAAQTKQLRDAGAAKDFREMASGRGTECPARGALFLARGIVTRRAETRHPACGIAGAR
jgi:hypothetical protein